MNDEVRQVFERELSLVRDKIELKKDNVKGSLYAFGVGVAGMTYGVFMGADGAVISGMIVSAGSLLYRCLNNEQLYNLKDDEATIEDILNDPRDFIETMQKIKK